MSTNHAQALLWTALEALDAEGVVRAHQAGADVSGSVLPHGADSLIGFVHGLVSTTQSNLPEMKMSGMLSGKVILSLHEGVFERGDACLKAMVERGMNPLTGLGSSEAALFPARGVGLFDTMVHACLASGFEDDLGGSVMHCLMQRDQPRAEIERAVELGGSLVDTNVHGQTPLHVLWAHTTGQPVLWAQTTGRPGRMDLRAAADITQWALDQHGADLMAQDLAGLSVVAMMHNGLDLANHVMAHHPSAEDAHQHEAHQIIASMIARAGLEAEVGGTGVSRSPLRM